MEMYVISNEKPENLKILHDDFEEVSGISLTHISDSQFELISDLDIKKGNAPYRGYVMIDPDGKVVLKKINDYWGNELENTIKDVKEAYSGLQ